MNRSKRAVCWSLVLVIPLVVCFAALGDEGKVKATTTFLPKPDFEDLPVDEMPAGDPEFGGIRDECDIAPSPPTEGETTLTEPSDEFKPESFFDVLVELGGRPLSNLNPSEMEPLDYVNQAIAAVLAELETNGWYGTVQGDVGKIQAQLRRYVEGQKIGGTSASAVVDVLKELRAAAADLREVAKDDAAIEELYRSAQPNNPEACPSTNRGCRALTRMANALKNWEAVSGAASDSGTASDLQAKLTGIYTGFFSMTEATSRWVNDQARALDEITSGIVSNTKPVDGTNVSFSDWRDKLGLVEENLQWAFDHAGRADLDERSRLSAVTFGLDMAKQFKEDLEKMHQAE